MIRGVDLFSACRRTEEARDLSVTLFIRLDGECQIALMRITFSIEGSLHIEQGR